jgi:ribosomal-protein-serine acetyltransferase
MRVDSPIEPLLLDIPEKIPTPRLRLVVPGPGDGARIYPAVKESLEQLKPWMPWATDQYSGRDAEIWCRKARGQFHLREQTQYMILDCASGEHLGNVGMFKFRWDVRAGEIGYWLRSDRTGRGLMTEAVVTLRDYFVNQHRFRRIELRCDDRNTRSARVAERGGFTLEGIVRSDCMGTDGDVRNTRIYAFIPPPPDAP